MTLRIIAGRFKGRLLKTPKGSSTRPTQGMLREAVFNICQNEIEGAHFLDLFAGSGAMGFEALSRGAEHITLVEQNRFAVSCIKENIAVLDVESEVTLLPQDAARALARFKTPFHIIYMDPPYGLPITPILHRVAPHLSAAGLLFVEERYNPKKTDKPAKLIDLKLHDTRRFGIAQLTIFKKL